MPVKTRLGMFARVCASVSLSLSLSSITYSRVLHKFISSLKQMDINKRDITLLRKFKPIRIHKQQKQQQEQRQQHMWCTRISVLFLSVYILLTISIYIFLIMLFAYLQ